MITAIRAASAIRDHRKCAGRGWGVCRECAGSALEVCGKYVGSALEVLVEAVLEVVGRRATAHKHL